LDGFVTALLVSFAATALAISDPSIGRIGNSVRPFASCRWASPRNSSSWCPAPTPRRCASRNGRKQPPGVPARPKFGVDFPAAFYYNALANYRLANLDQAEKSARKAEALGAQNSFPQVSLLLGMVLANRGDYAAAANQLRSYLKAAPTAPNADAVRQQLANVESAEVAESKAQAAPAAK
jgi:hypothetical protein